MHRKTNISKCIYILAYAYVIANAILSNAQHTTNETDQSIPVQTEKIINVNDVSEPTNRTAPSTTTTTNTTTVDFMNEQFTTENGNDNVDATTIIPTTSIADDGTAKIVDLINAKVAERNADKAVDANDQMNAFPQDFDFNLDDLEDLNYQKNEGDNDGEDAVTDTMNRFDEFTLEVVTSSNDGNNRDDEVAGKNQRNVYRVAKSKLKSSVSSNDSTSTFAPWTNGSVTSFRMFTELYDQYRWNINHFMTNVSSKCGLDMQTYLNALNNEVEWALKGNFCAESSNCLFYVVENPNDDLRFA